MTDLRTPGSRAVLIGTSTYASNDLDNVYAVADTVNDLRQALIERCGMARESIRLLADWEDAQRVGSTLAREAERTEGILVVYYAGHGLVGPGGELYLAVGKTDPAAGQIEHTALSYDVIRRQLADSPAQAIIVILDCCFSGLARTPDGAIDRGLATVTGLEGGVVLTSAAREEHALAPEGDRYTAFTGQLLALLTEGDPDAPAELTLRDVYRYLDVKLTDRALPRPRWLSAGVADDIVLAANPARRATSPPQPPRAQLATLPDEDERLDPSAVALAAARDGSEELPTGPIGQNISQRRINIDSAIRNLADIAENLDIQDTARSLHLITKQLQSDTCNLIAIGRFKNGKSTLVNALLADTTRPVDLHGQKGPMPVDDLPATATLTGVRYAEAPYVQAWRFDESAEAWSFDRYHDESSLGIDDVESRRNLHDIREFEIGYPSRLCKKGVLVYDSPGLDENNLRTAITLDAVKKCDAAIIVYRSDSLMGQSELDNDFRVRAQGIRIFTVVNLQHETQVHDRLRGYVWNRYVHDHLGGPAWSNQDLSEYDIYFVNAKQGLDGRYDDDEDKVRASGLVDFERSLERFLVQERQPAHLQAFATLASNLSATVDEHVARELEAAQQDREALKTEHAEAVSELAMIQEHLGRLSRIFARYRHEAEAMLTHSFIRLVAEIRAELPGHLESLALPSGQKYGALQRQRRLAEDTARAISDFIAARVDKWAEETFKAEIDPILRRLNDEIKSNFAVIVQIDKLDALVTSNPSPGAGGLRGAAGGITSITFATSLSLLTIGIIAPTPMTLGLGFLSGGTGFDARVKRKVLEECDGILARAPAESGEAIASHVAAMFKVFETAVTEEIRTIINERQYLIEQEVERIQREAEDRDEGISALTRDAQAITKNRHVLQQAITLASVG